MSPGLSGQGCRSIATMRLRPTDVTGSGGNNPLRIVEPDHQHIGGGPNAARRIVIISCRRSPG